MNLQFDIDLENGIKTTSLAGSLHSAYKARIPARPYWGSEYSITCTTIPTTAKAVFYLFLFTDSPVNGS